MDDTAYQQWWALHERAARGQALSEDEQVTYESGLHELQNEEVLVGDFSSLRHTREMVIELDAKCDEFGGN